MIKKNVLIIAVALFFAYQSNAQEQKEIKVGSFDEVKFEGSAQWILVPSDEEKVVIVSKSKDVFDFINVEVIEKQLVISTTDKNKNITKLFRSVTIRVYLKSIHSVYLSGVGSVTAEGKIVSSQFTATLKGTGDMNIDVQCTDFAGNMFGTGVLTVEGKTHNGLVKVKGAGGFHGFDLVCANMNVTVSGVGAARVYATESLTAKLNGVGAIKYKGNPEVKNLDTNGLGNIKNVDK